MKETARDCFLRQVGLLAHRSILLGDRGFAVRRRLISLQDVSKRDFLGVVLREKALKGLGSFFFAKGLQGEFTSCLEKLYDVVQGIICRGSDIKDRL